MRRERQRTMISYYLYMGLLVLVLFLWAVIAIRDDGANGSGNGKRQ